MKERYIKGCEEPLCAFCVSAAFFIRGVSSTEKTQTAPLGRQFSFSIPSYTDFQFARRRHARSANLLLSITDLYSTFKKRRNLSLAEILAIVQNVWQGPEAEALKLPAFDIEMENKSSIVDSRSPIAQRRRLSVPETVMRKHNLALEKASFYDSKQYHWDKEIECSSDPNLIKKRDNNVMRKSTLLRRLWGDSSKSKLSGSFQEWQYKKLSSTQSLNSNHSSPEHLPKKFEFSSPSRKQTSSPNRMLNKSIYANLNISPKRKISLSQKPKTPISRESTTKYTYSSFTNMSSDCDSAYSNSVSNLTSSVSMRSNTKDLKDENRNIQEKRESAVQTQDVTNLNVISNICLSQSTLDVIFKEIIKDVAKQRPGDININTATVTSEDQVEMKIKKAPGLLIDKNSDTIFTDPTNFGNILISNEGVGTPYSKPIENSRADVPRFSAVPRTSSMEVNTSEEDKEESDSVSFVDSLEDFSSPRLMSKSHKNYSDVTQLLPEGKKETSSKKSSSFFIPIVDNKKESKSVSELLPLRVKEKLIERQQKREEKLKQFRNPTQSTTNNISVIKSSLNFANYLPKKRSKPILPSIASLQKSSSQEKSRDEILAQETDKFRKNKQTKKSINKHNECDSIEKRIQILEIIECAETSAAEINKKSKIPLLLSNTPNKKTELDKPVYLNLNNRSGDSKVDQLIANILIDSLNYDLQTAKYQDKKNSNLSTKSNDSPKMNGNTYLQHFDVIPEEFQTQEISSDNNNLGDPRYRPQPKDTVYRENDNSSIPKGWVTVYTMHKDLETPESTSDEGKKYLTNTKEATNAVRERKYQEKIATSEKLRNDYQTKECVPSIDYNNSSLGKSFHHDSFNKFQNGYQSESAGKKEGKHRKSSRGKWSVTISGSNTCGQLAPDVEMRLKFPKNYRSESNSSYEKESSDNNTCSFPRIDNEPNLRRFNEQFSRESRPTDQTLPKIETTRNKVKKRENCIKPSIMVPRQTKTSTSRYHFSRPRARYSLPDVPSLLNESQYFEIIKRIPDILAIAGRSVSSEQMSFEER